jgi:hypothetical protein
MWLCGKCKGGGGRRGRVGKGFKGVLVVCGIRGEGGWRGEVGMGGDNVGGRRGGRILCCVEYFVLFFYKTCATLEWD